MPLAHMTCGSKVDAHNISLFGVQARVHFHWCETMQLTNKSTDKNIHAHSYVKTKKARCDMFFLPYCI